MAYEYICPHTGLEFNYEVTHCVDGCGPPNDLQTETRWIEVYAGGDWIPVNDPSPQLEESLLIHAEEQDAEC